MQTVSGLVDDFNAGCRRPACAAGGLDRLVRTRQPRRRRRRRLACHRCRRGRAVAKPTGGRVASSPLSPTCSPRQPPRSRRRRAGAGCATGRRLAANCLPAQTSRLDLLHSSPHAPAGPSTTGGRTGRDDAVAVAPELVLQRQHHRRARVDGRWNLASTSVTTRWMVTGVAPSARGGRLPVVHLREVVGEHHRRAVDLDRGMDQLAVGTGDAAQFLPSNALT